MTAYTFADQHLIVAFRDAQFVGVLITVPGETLTLKELLEYFAAVDPTYFIAERVPLMTGELTPENFRDALSEQIQRYAANDPLLIDNPSLLYIPRTLH